MKVLMISTDKKIFEERSAVRERMVEYGKLFDELHIVVFKRRIRNQESRIRDTIKISNNVFVYSTNSISKLSYIFDAIRVGKKITHDSQFMIHNSIITSQDPFETGLVGWLISRKFKIKLQMQLHTDFLSKYFLKHSVSNRVRVVIAKFLLPKADCVRVVSKRIADSLKTIVSDSKIHILPIFVDIEKIKNTVISVDLHKKYPQFESIVLMVSRLEREKNIPLAIFAMKDVVKKYPKTGLVIVGDGSERKALESKVKSLKLKDIVIFDGWKSKETIYSYYKTADLFLITSDYEGYGMTIIEALTSGLSVLSTDVGVAREAGAHITDCNNIAENIVIYTENDQKTAGLANYPYKNRQDYLDKFKQSFKCVS